MLSGRRNRLNPEQIKTLLAIAVSVATLLGGFYVAVTRPLLLLLKAEMKAVHLEIENLRTEVNGEFKSFRSEIKADIASMELRLNDRIDARLARH